MNMPSSSLLRILNIFIFSAFVALFSDTAFGQSSLTDDAHTSTAQRSGDSNFGTNPNLSLSSSGNVYIKFNIASTLPSAIPGSKVERATLKLFIGNIASPGRVDVYEVISPWQEGNITANTAPILGSLVATTQQITIEQRGKFLVIDVTTTVRQWLGSDGQGAGGIANHGIALLAHPVDANTSEVIAVTFDSKENSQTSHEPGLHIQLKDEANGGLQAVAHDATLTGDGTSGSPLGVASGTIGTTQLTDGAVTEPKLADSAVTSGKLGDGAVTSAKIAAPLSLASADPGFTLSVANTGGGAAITAAGAISVTGNGLFTGNLTASGNISVVGLRTEATATTPNVIGGFSGNSAMAGVFGATIGGGGGSLSLNLVTDSFGTIGGGFKNQVGDNAGDTFDNGFATVAGGSFNTASGNTSTISGGALNTATGNGSFIGGGNNHTASGGSSTVGGGTNNTASGSSSTIAGGVNNIASGSSSVVGGGLTNTASGDNAAVVGGAINTASGSHSVVPGGFNNAAAGSFSFAAGRRAKANHNGAVVWADSSVDADMASTASNQFLIRAAGGVGIGTNAPTDTLHVGGTIRLDSLGAAGTTQLCRNASNQISDCSSSLKYKHQIAPFTSGLDLIEKLRPISFTWMQAGTRDLGFGAEDVALINPLLVTRNERGDVEGVKYDRIAVVLVNAVNQQQQLIKAQQAMLESQQRQIESLKMILCLDRPHAQLCK